MQFYGNKIVYKLLFILRYLFSAISSDSVLFILCIKKYICIEMSYNKSQLQKEYKKVFNSSQR